VNAKRKKARRAKDVKEQEVREFVPYKVAVRIRDTISFSTRLDGRDDSLKLTENTIKALDQRDKENDLYFHQKNVVNALKENDQKDFVKGSG